MIREQDASERTLGLEVRLKRGPPAIARARTGPIGGLGEAAPQWPQGQRRARRGLPRALGSSSEIKRSQGHNSSQALGSFGGSPCFDLTPRRLPRNGCEGRGEGYGDVGGRVQASRAQAVTPTGSFAHSKNPDGDPPGLGNLSGYRST